MGSRSIIFFGDASKDIAIELKAFLLTINEGSVQSKFIHNVHKTLRDECLKLSLLERSEFPGLDDIYSLFRHSQDDGDIHPALQAAEIVTLQLGSFIAAYEQDHSEPYPTASENIIIGVCLGELSAAAVSLASSLTQLLPLAVESVRVAFRTGIMADRVSRELERPVSPRQKWSITISRDNKASEQDFLDNIHKEIGLPRRSQTYISAYGPHRVTLSGPPASLKQVTQKLISKRPKVKLYELPIKVPFHAGHLFSSETIDEILDVPETCGIYGDSDFDSECCTLINGSNGSLCKVPSRLALLKEVLEHILIQPVDWELMCQGCHRVLSGSQWPLWNLRPFGVVSTLESLALYLNKDSTCKVKVDNNFWKGIYTQTKPARTPLAIVGMAGRFPGANNHNDLWQLLMEGRDCHEKIPKYRFDPETDLSQPAYGCFIDSPGMFDSRFFNMSPTEALQTEPGQRILLTTAYEALEMAGFVPNRTASTQLGRVGTFYGQTVDEYKEQNMPADIGSYFIPGSLRAFGPGRLNRFFKFGGPATSIDTACSSSSVALNAACSAIWNGECDMAIAGGANILASPDNYVGLSAGHFLSPTGGCKTFDDNADGYCRADAVASVVIKRLDAAEADNDNVLGVILSAATNYSADAVSITQPHDLTQKSLYKHVLDLAGIQPFDIDYVEMHGTGTQAGDACEMESVTSIFAPASPRRPEDSPLWLNAVKANIGHGEAASGVTSLIKALLVLREGSLPPHIGVKSRLNRNFINLSERNVRIPMRKTTLPTKEIVGSKRRILVNNFGAAGGNTAVIVEEPPARPKANQIIKDDRSDHVINITAKTFSSLRGNSQSMLEYLESNPNVSLSDLSYTTTARRIQYRHRISLVCSTVPELKAGLETAIQLGDFKAPDKVSNVIFAFTGQGTFYTSLGKGLYRSYSSFRTSIRRLNKVALDHGFPSFLPIVDGTADEGTPLRLVQLHISILAVQIGLFQFLASLGVRADLVIGHSLGEYGALCASGILAPSDAIYLVGKRSELLEKKLQASSHSMLAIKASAETILDTLLYPAEIACINGPSDTVLSGPATDMSKAREKLRSCGFKCTVLDIPYAFHSSQVDPILDEFETIANGVNFEKPRIPLISTLLNDTIDDIGVISPGYLRRQTRETVDFAGSIYTANARGHIDASTVWVEIGPHPLCINMVKSILGPKVKVVPTLRRQEESLRSMAKAVSTLSSLGVDSDWSRYHRDYESCQRLLVLPSYCFEEKNYWIKRQLVKNREIDSLESGPGTTTVQKLVWKNSVGDSQHSMLFESNMSDPDLHAAIAGHSVNGSGLVPASLYGDMAFTIARYIRDNYNLRCSGNGMEISDMTITHPITMPHARPTESRLLRMLVSANLNTCQIEISFGRHDSERDETKWSAKCTVLYGDAEVWEYKWSKLSYLIEHRIKELVLGVSAGNTSKLLRGMVYRLFSTCVDYNTKYQAMQEVLICGEDLEATALLNLYRGTEGGNYFCSPFWIDALVHLAGFVMNANDAVDTRDAIYISGGWKSMRLARTIDPSVPYHVHVKMHWAGEKSVAGDVSVLQGDRIVAFINDLKFQKVPLALLNIIIPPTISCEENVLIHPKVALKKHPAAHEAMLAQMLQGGKCIQTPLDRLTGQVFEIIAEQVGITTQEIYEINNFVEIGIDSLLSLQIAAAVKEKLSLEFDSHMFLTHTTAQRLNKHLTTEFQALASPASESVLTNSDTEESVNSNISSLCASAEDGLPLLQSIIAEQLGVDVHELFEVQDLAELGLDSLMNIQITAMLEQRFGIKVKPGTLTSIEELIGATGSSPAAPRFETLAKVGSGYQHHQQQRSIVLQGRSAQATRTIFLFPDGSGSPAIYSRLDFAPGQLIVALQSPFIRNPRAFNLSIEAMAGLWVEEIQKYHKRGPYFLVGYSCGGYYALEAARQLLAAGAEIGHLLLIDSPSPLEYEAMPAALPAWLSQQGILGSKDSTNENLEQHFVSTIKAINAYCPVPVRTTVSPIRVTVIWASYNVPPCLDTVRQQLPDNVRMTGLTEWLLQRPNVMCLDADGWQKLLPDGDFDVKFTPGHHFSVLNLPNCRKLSNLINETLSMTN